MNMGVWSNGMTAVSKTVSEGSIPSAPVSLLTGSNVIPHNNCGEFIQKRIIFMGV